MNKLFLLWRTKKPQIFFSIIFQKLFTKTAPSWNKISLLFEGKKGLEIGGPSGMFQLGGWLPFYSIVAQVDGCNFSNQTVWEGELVEGNTYRYTADKNGHQYICDAIHLEPIKSSEYDFVLSCNSLEHIANPLKAIEEWIRVLKTDGYLVLVLPKKESNFDHKRPITSFEHLLLDYSNNTDESDLTHLPEILELHDIRFDYQAGGKENFRIRSMDNINNRCLHHHIFNISLLEKILTHFKLQKIYSGSSVTDYIIIGKKTSIVEK